MTAPWGFSWIKEPLVAGMARPDDPAELAWLRDQGIQLVITLTEDPIRRDWLAESSLLALHVPIPDMHPPSLEQIREVLSAIRKANERSMGVAVHCFAGRGRTGTILACYLVEQGVPPQTAIEMVRTLRPGSIETFHQELAVEEFARAIQESSE